MNVNCERFNCNKGEFEGSEKVDASVVDLFALYEKHGMSISHEDCHGGFIIEENKKSNRKWINSASFDLGGKK